MDEETRKAIMADENLRKSIVDRAGATAQRAQMSSASLANPSGFSASIPTASPFPIRGLSSLQPQQPSSIPIAGGGTASFGLGGATMNYPYSYGTITRTPQQFASGLPQAPVAPSNLFSTTPVAESLRPTTGGMLGQMYTNPFRTPSERMGESLTLGLTPVAQPVSLSTQEGPISLRGATAMIAPQTALQQGRMATETPYGTIYATFQSGSSGPRQLENLNARSTAYVDRSPAEQQALLAQMREKGAQAGARYTQMMKNFAESRGPRFAPMAAPQGLFGQPLTKLFPQSIEGIAQRAERAVPVLAATGFGAMQRSMGQSPALRGPLAGIQSPFANMGVGSYASRFAGGPQPAQSTSLLTDQQRRNIFRMV